MKVMLFRMWRKHLPIQFIAAASPALGGCWDTLAMGQRQSACALYKPSQSDIQRQTSSHANTDYSWSLIKCVYHCVLRWWQSIWEETFTDTAGTWKLHEDRPQDEESNPQPLQHQVTLGPKPGREKKQLCPSGVTSQLEAARPFVTSQNDIFSLHWKSKERTICFFLVDL